MNHTLTMRRLLTVAFVTASVAVPAAQADNGGDGGSTQPDSKHPAEA